MIFKQFFKVLCSCIVLGYNKSTLEIQLQCKLVTKIIHIKQIFSPYLGLECNITLIQKSKESISYLVFLVPFSPSFPVFLFFSPECLQFYFVTKKKLLHVWPKAKGECQINPVTSLRINDGISIQHALGFLCSSFAKINLWAAQYLFGRGLEKSLIIYGVDFLAGQQKTALFNPD